MGRSGNDYLDFSFCSHSATNSTNVVTGWFSPMEMRTMSVSVALWPFPRSTLLMKRTVSPEAQLNCARDSFCCPATASLRSPRHAAPDVGYRCASPLEIRYWLPQETSPFRGGSQAEGRQRLVGWRRCRGNLEGPFSSSCVFLSYTRLPSSHLARDNSCNRVWLLGQVAGDVGLGLESIARRRADEL